MRKSTGVMDSHPNSPQPPEDSMTQWITDRLPTLEDADSDGYVQIPTPPNKLGDHRQGLGRYIRRHFSLVPLGLAWRSPISVAEVISASSAACAVLNESPPPNHSDPMEQARLDRYRAKTALIEARTTLLLAQAKAIAFPPHPPQPPPFQPPMMPGQPVPDGVILSGTRYATEAECKRPISCHLDG
jgi:hypothetical protein